MNDIWHGDCFGLLDRVPSESVALVLTDPPYNISSEMKISRGSQGKFTGNDISGDFGSWDHFDSMESYVDFTKTWVDLCADKVMPGGYFISWFDKRKLSLMFDLLEDQGFKTRDVLTWVKCLSDEQVVTTKGLTMLSKIGVGDEVLTRNGYRRVSGVAIEYACPFVIKTRLGTFRSSANHKFLTQIGPRGTWKWRTVEELSKFQSQKYMAWAPLGVGSTIESLYLPDYLDPKEVLVYRDEPFRSGEKRALADKHQVNWDTANWYFRRMFVPLFMFDGEPEYLTARKHQKRSRIPARIPLDYDLGWVIGLFLAEGNYSRAGQVRFSLNSYEVTFVERLKDYVSKFGITLYTHNVKGVKSVACYFGDKVLRKGVFEVLIKGHGAHGKRINWDTVLHAPIEFKQGLWDGMYAGDGSKTTPNERIGLCNRGLVEDLRLLGAILGKRTSYGYQPTNRAHSLCVYTVNPGKVRVFDIHRSSIVQPLYDIAVDGGEFQFGLGVVSHNSNPVPQVRKVKMAQATEMAVVCSKPGPNRFQWQRGYHPNWKKAPIVGGKERLKDEHGRTLHPTQKPLMLFRWLIDYYTVKGDTVLDPFCGTGTTAEAAIASEREFICMEAEERYFRAAAERAELAQSRMLGFYPYIDYKSEKYKKEHR